MVTANRKIYLVFSCTFLCGCCFFIFTAYPPYLTSIGFTLDMVGTVMGAFFFGTLAGVVGGVSWLIARFGANLIALLGTTALLLTTLSLEMSNQFHTLTLLRFVQGVSWSFVLLSTTVLVVELSPKERLGQSLGIYGAIFLLCQAAGPWIGEALSSRSGSFSSAIFFAAGMASFGALALTPLLTLKSQKTEGTWPLRDANLGELWRYAGSTFLFASGFGIVFAFIAEYTATQDFQTYSPFFYSFVLVSLIIRTFFGRIFDDYPRARIAALGALAQSISMFGLALLQTGSLWQLWLIGAVFGIAGALFTPAVQATTVSKAESVANGTAIFNGSFLFGVAFFSYLGGFFADLVSLSFVFVAVSFFSLVAALAVLAPQTIHSEVK